MKHIGRILLLLTIVSCERQSEDFYLHFENTGDKHICIDYDLGYPVDSLKVIKNIMDPHNPCYEIAPKTKSNVRKKRSRKNLKNFLTENNNFTSKKKNRNYFAVFCFNFVSFCYFKRSRERFSKMILSA